MRSLCLSKTSGRVFSRWIHQPTWWRRVVQGCSAPILQWLHTRTTLKSVFTLEFCFSSEHLVVEKMYCSPHISCLPVALESSAEEKWSLLSSQSLVFLNRVKPLLSTPVLHKWDNGATHPTTHWPDILNLWEGEHPYTPAYVSVARQKVHQRPEASFCPFWCQQRKQELKLTFTHPLTREELQSCTLM